MSKQPMPRPTAHSAPFWAGCNQGKLMLQRCMAPGCRRHVFYPRVCCPHCGHGVLEWVEASGKGRIVTFTLVHRPGHDAFLADAPYCFAAIGLDEGPLIYGRLEPKPPSEAGLIGRPVKVRFGEAAAGQKLPHFELA